MSCVLVSGFALIAVACGDDDNGGSTPGSGGSAGDGGGGGSSGSSGATGSGGSTGDGGTTGSGGSAGDGGTTGSGGSEPDAGVDAGPEADSSAPMEGGTEAGAEDDAGSADAAGGDAEVIPAVCVDYCDRIEAACTGDNEQFANRGACTAACIQYPTDGNQDDVTGDTLQCRQYHLGAAEDIDADLHCNHAGPTGGGECE